MTDFQLQGYYYSCLQRSDPLRPDPDPLHRWFDPDQAEATRQWLSQPRNHFLTQEDRAYPPLLREIADAPEFLFVKGDPALLAKPMVAIVGSRHATRQGCMDAESFAEALSTSGITVVSGLATGIDAAAHRGALKGPGGTVAVIATGADRVYPASNRELAREIASCGALVSEFPLGTAAQKWHFPKRNRIISGLSSGCVVVEATLTSGSIITAQLALEQGREVFAIPGSIHSPFSKGCHRLIREGAKLVETARDILEELHFPLSPVAAGDVSPAVPEDTIPRDPRDLLFRELLHSPLTLDQLCLRTGLTAGQVSLMLTSLELEGEVSSLPGGRYQRLDFRRR
ncbi:MAG: DNA-processing protein DprA [Betaproteobacteria bacterium]|nr:DNA-processing protein DprA [Betaproteobacteria bacterium]